MINDLIHLFAMTYLAELALLLTTLIVVILMIFLTSKNQK